MAKIAILERKCTGCGVCAGSCPFGAIDMKDGKPELNAACKVCGVCVKACPEKAILKLETKTSSVDKSKWHDILVFAEVSGGRLHALRRLCTLRWLSLRRRACAACLSFRLLLSFFPEERMQNHTVWTRLSPQPLHR